MAELIPEPPDRARIEWEHGSDVYAAWRDDASSVAAGWTSGDGGEVWCLYGQSVPCTWAVLLHTFGESLRNARRLYAEEELREAVAAVQLRVIGEHIVEPGGHCRTCTSHHSTHELARLEDRLAEEEGERRG